MATRPLRPGRGAVPRSGNRAGRWQSPHLLARLSRIDVLVIDDWAMAPMTETERRDFWEICEDRYQTSSTILTSQLPVTRGTSRSATRRLADGILDRLVHNAHRIEMRGDSMRKKRGGAQPPSYARRGCCGLSGDKGCAPFPAPLSLLRPPFLRCAPDVFP